MVRYDLFSRHLWVNFNKPLADRREVIIDTEKDVRVCDGNHVIKIRFYPNDTSKIRDILVDDIFVWRA